VRESGGYKIVADYGQYHASVLTRQLNPLGGRNNSFALVLETENQTTASRTT
jgi:hypothetical protein